jgi:large subunit ribosomal protein L31e
MKSDDVKLDQDLNRQIWKRGKANPPRRARLRMVRDDDGTVVVSLYEEANSEETKRGQKDDQSTDSENDGSSQ